MAKEESKDWINEGLDSVEAVFDLLQSSYDSLPNIKKARGFLTQAGNIVDNDLNQNYDCDFELLKKVMSRTIRSFGKIDDYDKAYNKLQRSISRDIRNCFKKQYGDLM